MYSEKSGRDKGSLFQLKNSINRTNVPTDPKNNMNAAEAFFEDALASHILAAACSILGFSTAGELFSLEEMPPTFAGVTKLTDDIVARFTDLESIGTLATTQHADEVQQCATDTLTIGLLWHTYHDAVKEGNGEMVITIWRYLLLIFRMTQRKNYATEAAHLLVQLEYLSSERTKMQLKFGRFVSMHNQIGKNIPCDLHMEHLNRYVYTFSKCTKACRCYQFFSLSPIKGCEGVLSCTWS